MLQAAASFVGRVSKFDYVIRRVTCCSAGALFPSALSLGLAA